MFYQIKARAFAMVCLHARIGAQLLMCVSVAAAPRSLASQNVNSPTQSSGLSVQVVSIDGSPVAGALVALIDSNNHVVFEGLTSEQGRKRLVGGAGEYRVRIRRIGFEPVLSKPVVIPTSDTFTITVGLARISLNNVVVTAKGQCRNLARDAGTLAVLWSEIEKALQSSQLTLDDLAGLGEARTYSRDIGTAGEVFRDESRSIPISNRRPFGVIDPAALAKKGYVRGNVYSGWEVFGPDESVLLSSDFANTHCFSIVRDSTRKGEVGVGFKPVPKRKVPDIAGVLWIDENTAELREMSFLYVNANLPEKLSGGGETHFRRLESGAWIVNEWKLTMPRMELRRVNSEQFRVHNSEFVQTGFIQRGGAIVVPRNESSAVTGLATLSGNIFDSLANKPLSGAVVSIGETTVVSDSRGRFVFQSVNYGTHAISFSHPSLTPLGLVAIERDVEVVATRQEVMLSVPSLTAVWPRLCQDMASTRVGDDRRGVLRGVVRSSDGRPVDGGTVRISWREIPRAGQVAALAPPSLKLEVVTDNTGQYSACGFSSKTAGTVEALLDRRPVTRARFDFREGSVLLRDLVLPGQ